MQVKPSQLAQAILTLKGKPLNLDEYAPFKLVYDTSPPILTACCGRQIGKSVSLAAAIISNSILRPYFNTLFLSPLSIQTSRFSSQYLDPFISSPLIRNHFQNANSIRNTFSKSFSNSSSVTLSYAETEQDADRVRGVSADAMYFDEVQDVSIDALPVLEETLSAAENPLRRYTGTAKSSEGTLNILMERSNGLEWCVKCPGCGRHNIPNTMDMCMKIVTANPNGPGCYHCGHLLDMRTGIWLAARETKNHIGVHIPQFCIPARTGPKKWKELTEKVALFPRNKVANEIFGIPTGAGDRPLSMQEVKACCNEGRINFDTGFPEDGRGILFTTLGVDWAVTGAEKAYTVITILGFDLLGKAYILHVQRLDGIDIVAQTEKVIELYNRFKCCHIGSDRGVGVVQGQLMQRSLGMDRVSIIQYVSAKNNLRFDKIGGFWSADRTILMEKSILKIKMGASKLESPRWDIMQWYWKDALNVFEEETSMGKKVFRKSPDVTDDSLHSLGYALLAHDIAKGEFIYQDEGIIPTDSFDF